MCIRDSIMLSTDTIAILRAAADASSGGTIGGTPFVPFGTRPARCGCAVIGVFAGPRFTGLDRC